MKRARMNGDGDAGREYAEIWGEAVQANRKLRTILIFLSASCVRGVFVLLRLAGAEPPKPIVVRVDRWAAPRRWPTRPQPRRPIRSIPPPSISSTGSSRTSTRAAARR